MITNYFSFLECINGTSKSAIAFMKAFEEYSKDIEISIRQAICEYPNLSNISKYNIFSYFYKENKTDRILLLKIEKLKIYNNRLFIDCGNNHICLFDELPIEIKMLICRSIKISYMKFLKK